MYKTYFKEHAVLFVLELTFRINLEIYTINNNSSPIIVSL